MTNLQRIQVLYRCLAEGEWQDFYEMLDENIKWTEMAGGPLGGCYIGIASIERDVFQKAKEEYDKWEGYSVEVDEMLDAGDTVVVRGRYIGRYLPNNKALQAEYAHFWRLKAGRVVEMTQYADTAKLNGVYTDSQL